MLCSGGDHISNNSSWNGASGSLKLYNPGATGYKKMIGEMTHADGTTAVLETVVFSAIYNTVTTAVNAVRFLMSSGNISTGTIRCYGMTKV